MTLDRDLPLLPILKFGVENLIRATALLLIAVAAFAGRDRIRSPVDYHATAILLSFALVYATAMMVAAPSLSERYLYVNLLVLCLVATRLATSRVVSAAEEAPDLRGLIRSTGSAIVAADSPPLRLTPPETITP
jgi:hypothetical protein